MKTLLLICALLVLSQQFQVDEKVSFTPGCYKKSQRNHEVIKNPITVTPKSDLPTDFNYNDIDGTNFLTLARNQHIPNYCGSCWAFAATSAVSDRIKILRKAQWPDINLAPQVLLSCDQEQDQGCNGGDMIEAYKYMNQYNITDETCNSYIAKGWTNGITCDAEQICKNCAPGSAGCWAQTDYPIYKVSEYGKVSGEEAMMSEIYKRGPITCGIAVTQALLDYKGGVFVDTTGDKTQTHGISVVGWGEDKGVPYWYVRNSWGAYWGIDGFFKLVRGIDNLGIEEDCDWAVPEDTWSNREESKSEYIPKTFNVEVEDISVETFRIKDTGCDIHDPETYGEHITGPLPQDYIKDEELPDAWDWRNIDGVNYMSWSVNQHIPQYCGSCWAQAAASTLADRQQIVRKNAFPQPAYAVQTIINCQAGGSCNGGNSIGVYRFAHTQGVPTVTCQQYVAKNPEQFSCSAIQTCMNCDPPNFPNSKCYPVDEYPQIKVDQYGKTAGINNMKKEIYARGPISCGICATEELEQDYKGGIFSQKVPLAFLRINHEIQVLGWGSENGEDYWIVRNSWGTYWGEQGYFRIKMDNDNLGINTQCTWATVAE